MYEQFYGLTAKPFQLRPDPNFYFGSKGHKRASYYLEYGLSQEEGFIVITGEIGAGKTTLLRNLFQSLPTQHIVAAQIVNSSLDAENVLRMVAIAFGIKCEGETKATILTKIENFLRECNRQGKRVLLLVDEAQNLTPHSLEELRMLSNFQTAEKSLLQTFLLGQPEFRRTLLSKDMKQLQQRVIATYHLGPLDSDETKSYIEHRLRTVGWNGDPSFSDDAFEEIYNFSGGIPRKINSLCDRLLLMGFLEKLHVFKKSEIEAVIKDLQQEFILPPAEDDEVETPDVSLGDMNIRLSRLEHSVTSILDLLKQVLLSSIKKLPKDKE